MRFPYRSLLAGILTCSTITYAANPVQGWYLGLLGGGSYSPSVDFSLLNTFTGSTVPGTLTYSLGGNVAGVFGYRYNKFRFEGELLFNMNNYDKIEVGSLTLKNHTTPNGLSLEGYTWFGAGLVNVFYEFYQEGSDSSLVPYVGLGLGIAKLSNSIDIFNIYYNNGGTSIFSAKDSSSAAIAQGILGLSYFVDDYTAVGIDFRLQSTTSVNALDSSLRVAALNVNFNYALDSSG